MKKTCLQLTLCQNQRVSGLKLSQYVVKFFECCPTHVGSIHSDPDNKIVIVSQVLSAFNRGFRH